MEYSIQSGQEISNTLTYNQLNIILKEFSNKINFELRNAENFKILAQLELDDQDKNYILSFNFQYYMSFFFITTKGSNLAEMAKRLLDIVDKTLEIHHSKTSKIDI
jgi:hypothetical protein